MGVSNACLACSRLLQHCCRIEGVNAVHFTKKFGLSAPEVGWVPTPTYILRRALILKLMKNFKPGRVLEIGCGSGALFYDLLQLGFSGVCVEQSSQARHIASMFLSKVENCQITDKLIGSTADPFDYVIAFEVLEHIEDDEGAICAWVENLKRGGRIVISVPSHHSKWSKSDEWAGHYRRYERHEIIALLEKCGIRVSNVLSYGWPLSTLIEPIRSVVHARQMKQHYQDPGTNGSAKVVRTSRSGIERSVETKLYPLYSSWLGKAILTVCIYLQEQAKLTDWGTGYIVVGER